MKIPTRKMQSLVHIISSFKRAEEGFFNSNLTDVEHSLIVLLLGTVKPWHFGPQSSTCCLQFALFSDQVLQPENRRKAVGRNR